MEFTYEVLENYRFLTYRDREEAYDRFSLNMLGYNEIKGLLPFSSIQENGYRKVSYAVSSLITLEEYISRPLEFEEILKILEGIAKTAALVEEYMLDAEGLVLETERIFVEPKAEDTEMVYLPVKKAEQKDILLFLRNLIGRFQYKSLEKSGYILKLSNDMNSGRIANVNHFLAAVKNGGISTATPVGRAAGVLSSEKRDMNRIGEKVPAQKSPLLAIPQNQQNAVGNMETAQQDDRKKRFGILGGEKKKKEFVEKKKKETKKKDVQQVIPGFAVPGLQQDVFSSPKPVTAQSNGKREEPKETKRGEDTGVAQNCAYLIRRSNGEKGVLSKTVNRIGRDRNSVDIYVGNNATIGRIHAQISQEDGKWYIEDLASRNHTYVNHVMVRGSRNLLRNGDVVVLAEEEFDFVIER